MSDSASLSLTGLGKSYSDLTALEGLDLDLHPGECAALMGHNGSGEPRTKPDFVTFQSRV